MLTVSFVVLQYARTHTHTHARTHARTHAHRHAHIKSNRAEIKPCRLKKCAFRADLKVVIVTAFLMCGAGSEFQTEGPKLEKRKKKKKKKLENGSGFMHLCTIVAAVGR